MRLLVHHRPTDLSQLWSMRVWQSAWDGNYQWDHSGTVAAGQVDFEVNDAPDLRRIQFKFHSSSPSANQTYWEPDALIRWLFRDDVTEVWTFDSSPRVLYQNPLPAGVAFNSGDTLTFRAITQNAFRGGKLYLWNPYDASASPAYVSESSRDDVNFVSTFNVVLQSWMTTGFHLKLMQPAAGNSAAVWEPDSADRVWRPCDGASLWMKSGQCDLRNQPLALTAAPVEVLYSAQLATPPSFQLQDLVEQSLFPVQPVDSSVYAGSPLFRVGRYTASIYPGASYAVTSTQGVEAPPIERPFPADPAAPTATSRLAIGASAWLSSFPPVQPIPLSIKQLPASSFTAGVSVQMSVGNGPAYATVPAAQQADGSWLAHPSVANNTTTAFDLIPAQGSEPKPYDWIDTSRYFTPEGSMASLFTTEGVYGVSSVRPTAFAEPPSRVALMQAAFGSAVVASGVFAQREMPAGATALGSDVYFVVHAPHAVCASLILVAEAAAGGPTRTEFPMELTPDTFYWWCGLSAGQVAEGTRYRFLLNDDIEVLDPAARAVQDGGTLQTAFGESPSDPNTSWSMTIDVASLYATAHVQSWQTMGWQNLLIYEIHARRFSNLDQGTLSCFDLLVDEFQPMSRLSQAGYLRQLPVTTFGLMPVNEFSGPVSWGYDPSYYFAIDGFYGGAPALARFVNAAHQAGRAATLDVVYNHSLGSSLMSIAPDVYRNGDYDGDRMNCGHPMVLEYFRQASVYLFRTFNLDGFRFDDTNTIITKCVGGWQFLGAIRTALRAAATADGRAWPYCVAENSGGTPFDVSDPTTGVMDGQWGIDETYSIRAATYDSWTPGQDDSGDLKNKMDSPQYWGRPFFQVTRFGESHDMVSAQDPGNQRIAARPPWGQGYQMAKAMGSLTLLTNGVPMLFMGQEIGETQAFFFDNNNQWINPQLCDLPPTSATDQTRILSWFRQLMGLRNDSSKGLQGDANYQVVATGNRTVAFVCGAGQRIFAVVTFGTPNQQQDSSWLGLPASAAYKEIFNSSWPAFQVVSEPEFNNGGYSAQIQSGQILNLPWIGAVILERI
jgi:1,4-alpha-glucan branching enzyme